MFDKPTTEKIYKREQYWKKCLNTIEHGYNNSLNILHAKQKFAIIIFELNIKSKGVILCQK